MPLEPLGVRELLALLAPQGQRELLEQQVARELLGQPELLEQRVALALLE